MTGGCQLILARADGKPRRLQPALRSELRGEKLEHGTSRHLSGRTEKLVAVSAGAPVETYSRKNAKRYDWA
jgi:hypothetical protein